MSEQFINVRMQSMNGVNLNHFQFEYDLTWMSFFQNSAGRTYTRYGGREDHDAESHLNKASLLRVMRQVLILHRENAIQPDNRYEPVAKALRTAEEIPSMTFKLARRKEKCIHCHDVKAATLRDLRESGRLDKNMVYTYPSPSRLGIHLDPEIQFKVRRVDEKSPAEKAGIRPGDLIRTMEQQRVLTFADATRVLEIAPKTGHLQVRLERDKREVAATLNLPAGWRKNVDVSWRSTTGTIGPLSGIWGKRATEVQRKRLGLPADSLAMQVSFIWAPWARAAGVKNGDIILSIDGHKADMTIRQFQAWIHLNRKWGDKVTFDVRRGNNSIKLTFQFPEKPIN